MASKYGFIDKNGKVVIEPQFVRLRKGRAVRTTTTTLPPVHPTTSTSVLTSTD